MPYSIGERGSYGCSGYPVIKDDDKTVMGCHETMAQAQNQITAINMSESESSKKKLSSGMEGPVPASSKPSVLFPPVRRRSSGRGGYSDALGSISTTGNGTGMGTKSDYNDNTGGWLNAKPINETSEFKDEVETRNSINREIGKENMEIKEGDFVMGPTADGMAFGRVEHIMWEGGTLGQPGEEYSLESMPPENPAMSVRIFEVEENEMEPTPYSIGMMYQDAQVVDVSNMTMEQENEMEMMSKWDDVFNPQKVISFEKNSSLWH